MSLRLVELTEKLGITNDPPADPITGEKTAGFNPTKKPVTVADVDNAWRDGRAAFNRGDYKSAHQLFTFVSRCCPTWEHVYFALGWTVAATKNWLGEVDAITPLVEFNFALGFARADPQTTVRFLRSLATVKGVNWSPWWPEPLSPTFERWPPPRWRGGECENLLIMAQRGTGAGDLFHHARFLTPVAQRVKKLLIGPARLQPLLSHLPNATTDPDVALREATACVMIETLPRLLKGVIAPTQGYLSPPPRLAAPAVLAATRGRRIAFSWRGNQRDSLDVQRRTRIEDWRPLFEATKETATWLACAVDHSADLRGLDTTNVLDITPWLSDWGLTAATLMACDLVITVDTGLAHVAAALGRPTWLLLGRHKQNYWGEKDSSLQYPDVKIFRQPHSRDWRSVFVAARAALEGWLQSAHVAA